MDSRVRLDGKFFRVGRNRYYVKGLSYGPFAPDDRGGTFGTPRQAATDLALARSAGANLLRVYHVPPPWFLELAVANGIRLFVDVPWSKHLCFLESSQSRADARAAVTSAVRACRGHAALFAYNVVNEIPSEIVRWSGPAIVNRFIEDLLDVAHQEDPTTLASFTSYPPTEFLSPRGQDFVCFNVYLHDHAAFGDYLSRLQTLAAGRPLLLGEFGLDTRREGEKCQQEFLGRQIDCAFRHGLAGAIVFGLTDDWFTGGAQVEDWAFGITDRDRNPKPAFEAVRSAFDRVPGFSSDRRPRVSVVVASHNAGPTLAGCLDSCRQLDYPDFEVLLVDDGSTDDTAEIARRFPEIRHLRQPHLGLSAARNTGIAAATGEIVAFTDADCRVDRDWLNYLVRDLVGGPFQGMGGHNLLPPDDSWVSAAVMVSPGGPAHVLLDDREAEHIPGCNMAFYKRALEDIGGFDPQFVSAGDDVDVCWRLQDRGQRIGFCPAAFVWHHRRATVWGYLRQQAGYGRAESQLAHEHPERFNFFGGGIWRGRIYARPTGPRRGLIYHGVFGSGFFQQLYTAETPGWLLLPTSLNYHLFVTLPLFGIASAWPGFWPFPAASALLTVASCAVAAANADLPPYRLHRFSRVLVAWLHLLQPLVRGWHRYNLPIPASLRPATLPGPAASAGPRPPARQIQFWSDGGPDRYAFLQGILARLAREGWRHRTDSGWADFDVEIAGGSWNCVRLTTVTEDLGRGRRILRCRFQDRWSSSARRIFWGSASVAGLLMARLVPFNPWTWFLALPPALLLWLIVQKQRQLRAALASLVCGVAREAGLQPVRPASELQHPGNSLHSRGSDHPGPDGHRLASPRAKASMDG